MAGLMDMLGASTAMTPPSAGPAGSMAGNQAADAMMGMMGQSGAGVSPQGFNGEDVEQEPNVAPEEQAQYDAFVQNAMKFVYTPDGKILPDVMKRIKGGEPVEAMAQTVAWVVMMVESSAKSKGMEIADDVLYHAGSEVLEQLVEVVEATGYHDFTEEDMGKAWQGALDIYGQTAQQAGNSRVNPEVAAQELQGLVQAENEGHANDIIPGFDQLPQRLGMNAQEEEEEPT